MTTRPLILVKSQFKVFAWKQHHMYLQKPYNFKRYTVKAMLTIVKYSINTYVRYLSYALLIIAELPNDGNRTLNLPPLCL